MNSISSDGLIAIRARNVTLRLGDGDAAVDILRGIDLDVPRGERLAILGASGSGKSSLMAVLAGLEKPGSGTISLCGEADITTMGEDALALLRRRRVGIILQSFHLLPTMTALENVAVPLEFAGVDAPFARAAEALDSVGLAHRTGHYPSQLSGGEQQRVAIARAMASRPELVFADEPTGNLDATTGSAIVELLFGQVAATGASLVMITHDAALAERCDRIVTMRDGLIVDDSRQPVTA